jgi:hypothetical protein
MPNNSSYGVGKYGVAVYGGGGGTPVLAADTAVTISDTLRRQTTRAVSDRAVTIGDSLVRVAKRTKVATDRAVTVTDAVVVAGIRTARTVTDTGATISDTTVPVVVVAGVTGGLIGTDPYFDGTSTLFGAFQIFPDTLCVFTDAFAHWKVPREIEAYYARLPLPVAQQVLSETGAVPGSLRRVKCSWHGMKTDPERGAFALVRAGGNLDALIGERIRVTNGRGVRKSVVYGYVHGVADLDPAEELSLPRNLFLRLGLLGLDNVTVSVEALQ